MGRTGKTNNRLAVEKNTLLLKELNFPAKPVEHRMKLNVFIFCFCALAFLFLIIVSQIFHIIFVNSKFIFRQAIAKRFRKTVRALLLPMKMANKIIFCNGLKFLQVRLNLS